MRKIDFYEESSEINSKDFEGLKTFKSKFKDVDKMICKYCKKEISDKIYYLHMERCPNRYDQIKKEANEITFDKATKTDLMMYIMSESDEYNEDDLKKLKKVELIVIAESVK